MSTQIRDGFPSPSPPVGGRTDQAYAAARDVFTRVIAEGPETGAAVAVVHDGRLVLDLYGGWQDADLPWSPATLAPLFCLGKTAATIGDVVLGRS